VAFPPEQIGLKGSPTTVFRTTQPEKHTGGEVIKVSEIGLEPAIKSVFEKITKSGFSIPVPGGCQ
jgi:hypothetical protein